MPDAVERLQRGESAGTRPPCFSAMSFESETIARDLRGESPQGRMIFSTSSGRSRAIASGVSASANSDGVTSFTRLSVHCADSTTATSSVKASLCRSGIGGFG